jgi:hypothetical protein
MSRSKFDSESRVMVCDLGGKNQASAVRLSEQELAEIDLTLGETVNQTITEPLTKRPKARGESKLLSLTGTTIPLPALIYIDSGFGVFLR